MKKVNSKTAIHVMGKLILMILFIGCNNDDNSGQEEVDPPIGGEAVEVNYGVSLVAGAGGAVSSFLLGLTDLDVTTISNNDGTEVGQFTSIYSDGTSMFTAGFGAPATMKKYIFDDEGKAVFDKEIIVPGSNSFSTVEILDETKGYATVGGGISKVVVFNPDTMRITGEIDLSEAGEGLFYSDMISRDGYLFVALNDFGASEEVRIAVVNTNDNTLERIISDNRGSTLFNTLTAEIMVLDSNDDIYVQASGLFTDKPSGILRIKAGETEFDASYFFDLGSMEEKTYFGLYLTNDGEALSMISGDDDNFFGIDGTNPVFRYRKINLYTAQDLGDLEASLPNTFAVSRTSFAKKTGSGKVLFPIAGVDEDALYGYDPESQEVEKRITSNGGYISGLIILNRE